MSIDLQLYLISGGFALCTLIAAWQAYRLRKVYRSFSSWIGVAAFSLWGLRQLYGLYRLQATIEKSRAIIDEAKAKGVNMRGINLDSLSFEQWLSVGWSYAIILTFILWQHWQHRDLKWLGI